MSDLEPFAFVLMPFDSSFNDLYRLGIKKVAEELGIVAERVDEQHFSETILERVYRQIEAADFIIADMTGQNPNVFYEVGYAHAKGKLCALITQKADDIPFDLKHHTHVIYDGNILNLIDLLRPKLEWMKEESLNRKSSVFNVSSKEPSGFLDASEFFDRGRFNLEITIRNSTDRRSPEIEASYLRTSPKWRLFVDKVECPAEEVKYDGVSMRRHLINPPLRKLSPSAFMQIKPEFRGVLWRVFTGEEKRESYISRGTVQLEVVTSEGTFEKSMSVDVTFDEIPF